MKESQNSELEEYSEEIELLRKAGLNPREYKKVKDARHLEYYVAAGVPTAIGDRCPEDYAMLEDMMKIRPKVSVDVMGDSMEGAGIIDGDVLTVKLRTIPYDGDIVVASIDGEPMVKAYFIDDNKEHWLVPFNEKFKPLHLTDDMNLRIVGTVIEIYRTNPRASHYICQRIVTKAKIDMIPKKLKLSRKQQEEVIREVSKMIKVGRQWYAVYRPLIDYESELVKRGDFDGFCRLVARVVPDHEKLPTTQEMQRMAVMSFDKPVSKWDENNAPVTPGRFQKYLAIAESVNDLLGV